MNADRELTAPGIDGLTGLANEHSTAGPTSTPDHATDLGAAQTSADSPNPTGPGIVATTGSESNPALPTSSSITSPIKLGFFRTGDSNSGASALGASNGNTIAIDDVIKALIAHFNAHGGIAGRRIDPYWSSYSANAVSYQSQLESSCAGFTTDQHVAAVLSFINY